MQDDDKVDETSSVVDIAGDMGDEKGKKEKDGKQEEEVPDHPVDEGWAWVILGACSFISFVVIGIAKSYGIFFIEFLRTFKSSVSATTLITTLQTIAYCSASVPILSIYIKRYNTRNLAILGTFGCALSYGLSSLADSISFLYFSQSLLFGAMSACVLGPNLVILGQYFKKRRGFAMGIALSGNALGGFLLPYLFRYLFDEYGLRGALLLTAGLSLHCVAAACLLRPIDFYSKRKTCNPKKDLASENGCPEQKEKLLGDKKFHTFEMDDRANKSTSHPVLPTGDTTTAKAQYRIRSISYSPGHVQAASKPAGSTSVLSLSSFTRYFSTGDIVALSLQDIDVMRMNSEHEEPKDENKKPVQCFSKICQYLTDRQIFNCNIFRNKYFLAFLPAYSLGSLAPAFTHIFVPAYARDIGISDQNVATIASIISLSDFCGRIVVGFLADLPRIRKPYLVVASQTIIGIMMTLSSFFNNFYLLVAFAIIYGLVGGTLFTLFSPILIEMIGIKDFPNGMLVILVMQGIWIGGNASFLGYLRDLTGSYVVTLQFMGASSFTAALFFFTIEIVRILTTTRSKMDAV
ncbi:monocarboxylate transporter 5-like [Mizuhopecten yessoensis]|uniref:Monocarboxylate transporter 5 n=1 Tax=Mizuhopecten yessoensis TaxID=6573 RepID=A0A210QY53_MIZYE|nr:monocarboxylate transporter 5-like [Mizuhopecten yessoensis]OWF53679.1 Monocarboxylate transporter 5 [Mizuhopecten yessoensis]